MKAEFKKQRIAEIQKYVDYAVANYRLVNERIEYLNELLANNYFASNFYFSRKAMGSGGAGQMKEMKDGTVRFQLGYGVTRHNYADVLIINFN